MRLVEKMDEVRSVAEQIKQQGEAYDQLMDKMYQTIQMLEQYWTGNQQDYVFFMNRVAKEEKNLRMVGKIIQEYGQVLEDISSNTISFSDTVQSTIGKV